MTKTHMASGWIRTSLGQGIWRIEPPAAIDAGGARTVRFMSRHSWMNDPADDRANQGKDRVVLITGEPLPDWAQVWLETVNARMMTQARAAFQAAIDDADDAPFRDTGW
jgi:hypothetical protein